MSWVKTNLSFCFKGSSEVNYKFKLSYNLGKVSDDVFY